MRKPAGIVLIDLVLLAIGVFGLFRLSGYPRAPFEYRDTANGVEVTSSRFPNLLPQGTIVDAADKRTIKKVSDLSFSVVRKASGEEIVVEGRLETSAVEATLPLTQQYPIRYTVVTGIVAFSVLIVGLFIERRRSAEPGVQEFHWLMVSLMLTLAIATEQHFAQTPTPVVFGLRLFYIISFALIPAVFVAFAMNFLSKSSVVSDWMEKTLFLPAAIFIVVFSVSQFKVCFRDSLEAYALIENLQSVFYSYVLLFVVLGLTVLFVRYVRLASSELRKQMRWVFWGISVAAAPYVFLRALPMAIGTSPLVSEEIANVFFLIAPLSISAAIVKENLLDIDVVISRTVVYAILSGGVVLLYVLTVSLGAHWLAQWTALSGAVFSSLSVVIMALLFHPSKQILQNYVDKTFYRVKYDFQRALAHATPTLTKSLSIQELAEQTLQSLQHYLQLEGGVLVLHHDSGNQVWTRGAIALSMAEAAEFIPKMETSRLPLAVRSAVEETRILQVVDRLDRSKSLQLLFPVTSKDGRTIGVVGLSRKMSGRIFLLQEIEFANALLEVMSIELHRLQLQERAFADMLEKERLEREKRELEMLQKMREDLSHMVVHDLRSPLTSLLLGIEFLEKNLRGKIGEKEIGILESTRKSGKKLVELVNDLLEIHKMEEGQLKLVQERTEVKELVNDAIRQVENLAKQKEIELEVNVDLTCPPLFVDKEKITRVFVNLLSNSIKFSESKRHIHIDGQWKDSEKLLLAFKDQGPGIPPEYVQKVFDKFVQVESRETKQRFSTGLGLTYCKLAVEKHGGRIWAESELGKGSVFFVELPIQMN